MEQQQLLLQDPEMGKPLKYACYPWLGREEPVFGFAQGVQAFLVVCYDYRLKAFGEHVPIVFAISGS